MMQWLNGQVGKSSIFAKYEGRIKKDLLLEYMESGVYVADEEVFAASVRKQAIHNLIIYAFVASSILWIAAYFL